MRIGLFLGNMSGPGSGAFQRVDSLLAAIWSVDGAVEVVVYGPADVVCELTSYPNVSLRPLRRRSRLAWALFNAFGAARAARRDGLTVAQFETGPLLRRLTVPTVLTVHDLRFFHGKDVPGGWRLAGFAQRRLVRWSSRVATRVLTLSRWSTDDVVLHLGVSRSNVVEVPPSVDVEKLREASVTASGERQFVLALGHLEPRKNLATLIHAVSRSEWPDGLSLVIAGRDNGSGQSLRDLARRLGGPVVFVGEVSDGRKRELLNDALAVLVPSVLEGFGIVVSEAVMSGTPVLVSDKSALPEAVGVADAVVPAMDPEAWADRVGRLVGDDRYRADLLAREIEALSRFDHEQVGREYLKQLQDL